MKNSVISKAIEIAKRDLRSCYAEKGILTGSRGVYWSWDSFYASLGALEIGDFDIVKKNLSLYLNYQRESGNIPKRVAHPLYPLRYLGFPIKELPQKQKPNYMSPYFTGTSISQCPVFIIAFYEYVTKSGDFKYLESNFNKLLNMVSFLGDHSYKSGLLKESVGGGWAESVLKRGAIAYSNMNYVKSLENMADMARMLKKEEEEKHLTAKAEKVKKAVNKILWDEKDGGFYSDWVGRARHHYFVSDGNLLAILWGVASEAQSKKIDINLDKLLQKDDLPLPLTYSRYYFWRIYFTNILAGIKDYHVGFSWLWLGSLAAVAKQMLGQHEEAKKILESISKAIIQYGSVFEIYDKGRPVSTLFYKSEKPWAWAAGIFIYSCKKCGILGS